jgi:hypothetical protein
MALGPFPTVNDYEISWSEIGLTLNLDGAGTVDMVDCVGIKHESKLSTSRSGGTSGRKTKETSGEVEHTASWTLTKSGLLQLKTALISVAPKRNGIAMLSIPRFTVVVQHSTIVNPSIVHTTTLKGCRYRGESEDNKSGSDALTVELPLDPLEITYVVDGQECALL